MLDLNGAKSVEIRVSWRGDKVWINVNGECLLRIVGLVSGKVVVVDERTQTGGGGTELVVRAIERGRVRKG